MSKEINCEPLTEYDVYQVTKLLRGMKFHIGGARAGFTAIRDLCSLSLEANSPMYITVAKDARKQIVGVVLGVRDYHRFWLKYYFAHPLIYPRIAISKIKNLLTKSRNRKRYSAEMLADSDLDIPYKGKSLWTVKDDQTVHILLIIVDNSHRHKKIGQRLYSAFTEHLAKTGIKRVIARIGFANEASIKLHQKAGWTVYGVKRYVEALFELGDNNSSISKE